MKYETVRYFDRKEVNDSLMLCEKMFNRITSFFQKGDLILFSTVPTITPLKGAFK